MSYANGTQFYNLPQTVGTDKRDWFDTNSAFAAIDAALHAAATGQASDAEAIAIINGKLATDEADIAALQTKGNTHDSQIAALQTTVNTQANQISDVRQDAEDMITANNEGAAATSTRAYAIGDYFIYNDVLYKATAAIAVGDTIVPNTNCEATNVDTELTQVNNDLTANKDLSDNGVSLYNYDVNNPYICPSDGIVVLLALYGNNVATLFSKNITNNNGIILQAISDATTTVTESLYVTKGMKLYATAGANTNAEFYPLVKY